MKKILLGMIVMSLMVGCSTAKKTDTANGTSTGTEAASTTAGTAGGTTAASTATTGSAAAATADAKNLTTGGMAQAGSTQAAGTAGAASVDPMADPTSGLTKRSVYFAFDMDAIQEADKATIQAHGAFLGSHADRKVRAEGNADERGSSEYNLALGQRRANSTKKALVLSGAKADQIETISYGEERPQAIGHDETAWAQNRRTDINYR